jgi:uncharacterized protein
MSIKRAIKQQIDIYLKKYPIIVITGPRQSGKTTMLTEEFTQYEYVNLENPDVREYATTDPNGFLTQYNKFVIFDEVQRVPSLFSYLQTKVDKDKIRGQYILSGSQNFNLMQSITQSLAGRVALFSLLPFDNTELKSANWLAIDFANIAQKGFYPAIYDRDIPSKVFYANYISTYIQRDVTELLQVKDIKAFKTFITLCAARVGQLLNLSTLANECGITQPTAKAWLNILETSYITYQLQPYHSNINKRVTKNSKLYFYDTGLLCHLLKINDAQSLMQNHYKGNIFENFIISEHIKQNYHNNQLKDFWFWRDAVGHEIDLIWQHNDKLNLIEIKAGQTIMPDMFKAFDYFEKWIPNTIASKTLVYAGIQKQKRSAGNVLPWWEM